jgi:hypothetical protein
MSTPDAELLRLCAEFDRLHAIAEDCEDDKLREALARRWSVSDQIQEIAPVTPEGMRAKAKIATFLLEESGGHDRGKGSEFAYAMLIEIADGATGSAVA